MDSCFQHIPLGKSLPQNNPHAVSVSLPKLEDVIGYEENLPEVIRQMENGYPRFFKNKLVEKLELWVRKNHQLDDDKILFPVTSIKAKIILEKFFKESFTSIDIYDVCFLVLPVTHQKRFEIEKMIQHLGAIISSRNAEKILFELNNIPSVFEEEKLTTDSVELEIKKNLANAYSTEIDDIFLTNSGTNAVFAAIETLSRIQKKKGKTLNVQLGWLYLDTIEIIKKRSDENFVFVNIHQQDQFESWLKDHHEKVANIITETISNPLLQCVDLVWISNLCKKYGIGLILDNTMATPHCIDALPYGDVVVESLTKFACGNADVMMGAVIINQNSNFKSELKEQVQDFILEPYEEDCKRLALEIQDYESRMQKISENTFQLFEYLKKQDYIEKIYSVYEESSWKNFQKTQKKERNIGLLSVIFKKPFAECYNSLDIAKGPSLGTEFTLAMPYTYLAHYHLLKTDEGQEYLKKIGLPKEILRVSVGTEPIECLIREFEKLK